MGIIIEKYVIGQSMEVRAVDDVTGLEVSFISPVSSSNHEVENLARAKLKYVQEKTDSEAAGPSNSSRRDTRRGIVI